MALQLAIVSAVHSVNGLEFGITFFIHFFHYKINSEAKPFFIIAIHGCGRFVLKEKENSIQMHNIVDKVYLRNKIASGSHVIHVYPLLFLLTLRWTYH